jgi:hypothetical protein
LIGLELREHLLAGRTTPLGHRTMLARDIRASRDLYELFMTFSLLRPFVLAR